MLKRSGIVILAAMLGVITVQGCSKKEASDKPQNGGPKAEAALAGPLRLRIREGDVDEFDEAHRLAR